MSEDRVEGAGKRLLFSLGSMGVLIAILIAAILLFVSFGKGPSLNRAIAGIIVSLFVFILLWNALSERRPV